MEIKKEDPNIFLISLNYPVINIKYNGHSEEPIKTKIELRIGQNDLQTNVNSEEIPLKINTKIFAEELSQIFEDSTILSVPKYKIRNEFWKTNNEYILYISYINSFSIFTPSLDIEINLILESEFLKKHDSFSQCSIKKKIIFIITGILTIVLFGLFISNKTAKSSTSKTTSDVIYSGLPNLGNTCYMNAILQSFYYIKNFRDLILQSKDPKAEFLSNVFKAMNNITKANYENLFNNKKKNIEDYKKELKKCLETFIVNSFFLNKNRYKQMDAIEFYEQLFFMFNSKLTDTFKNMCSIFIKSVTNFRSDRKCEKENVSFYHIVDGNYSNLYDELLNGFDYDPQISGNMVFPINNYKDYTSKEFLVRTSNILCIKIARFNYLSDGSTTKKNCRFEFPEKLDLSIISKQCTNKYYLHSIVVHSGSINGGHYYCYIKINNKYYEFNDQRVCEVSKYTAIDNNYGDVSKSFSAYFLIYLKEGTNELLKDGVDY